MPSYRLTREAERDLATIYLWGRERFGEAEADTYFSQLLKQFETIAAYPRRYPSVDHILTGARRAVYGRNSIYFMIENDYVLIIGVIGRQDLEARFSE